MKQVSLILILIVTGLCMQNKAQAQWYKLKGTVYDSSKLMRMEAVSVMTSAGKGTITNADGHFEIDVTDKDSVWFSYLNKPTQKYPVRNIADVNNFEISLLVNIISLKAVKVIPRNYKQDSIQNRIDYAKAFDFQKPGIQLSSNDGVAGIDLTSLINMFRFRRNRQMLKLQKRLLKEEQEKFIDHRFNRYIVKRTTHLEGDELDTFMVRYRPPYDFASEATDLEFYEYILFAYYQFKGIKPPAEPISRFDQ